MPGNEARGPHGDGNGNGHEAYGVFHGEIDQQVLARMLRNLLRVTSPAAKITHVHILFQSPGGTVSDCVCLYNLFRTFTVELSLYNAGSIQSRAVTAYLGAKHRKMSGNGQFMLRRSAPYMAQSANLSRLESAIQSVRMGDAQIETIIRNHTRLPEELWRRVNEGAAIFVSAAEAVKFGLADEIVEFSPPPGAPIHYI
jgi:ATP-dependent Clp protease protease subunit